jgi:mono/diheme cytochrome c family protein
MTIRKLVPPVTLLVAAILSFMPLVHPERTIEVRDHHLDHAVLMVLGAIAGLAAYRGGDDRESPGWIWPTVLCPLLAMLLMAPSLYELVERAPWLHALDHVLFVALAFLTAYGGQRYVRGVGWASALFLETMAVVAAFGFGVAPVPTSAAAAPAAHGTTIVATGTGDAERGGHIFTQDCAACHGSRGQGGMGPSLLNESSRKDFTAAQAWIKKPMPPMPALYPDVLNAKDVADVAAFVETLK